ncbi:MAG: class I SAM-dependent methyltransferase [Planctomycetes bacterium]|nr:class I SAM-dependent methyltransferase [Planctomycetota bacterium]
MIDFNYELLDCGEKRRLERFGTVIVDRPAPQAEWDKALPAESWERAHLTYQRPSEEQGSWQIKEPPPQDWQVSFNQVRILLHPSMNGQVGIFPEQYQSWQWLHNVIAKHLAKNKRPLKVLNAFAYTGAATLAAAGAGAELCHLDSSRTAMQAARFNTEASGMESLPIRWLVEDTMRFLEREIKRGNRYDGFILDPPAFGRGGAGRTWSLSRDLGKLLQMVGELLSENPLLILLSCHAPEISAEKLGGYLREIRQLPTGTIDCHPLTIPSTRGNSLPCGVSARWSRE